jgi:hypothetical protein
VKSGSQGQEQWTTAKSRSVQATTQYVMEKDSSGSGGSGPAAPVQVIAYDTLNERGPAVAGACTPSPGIECRIRDFVTLNYVDLASVTAVLVDPSSCTTGPGESVGPGPQYIRTTCTNGPLAQAYGPVASCPGLHPSFSRQRLGGGDVRQRRRRRAGGVQRHLHPGIIPRRSA